MEVKKHNHSAASKGTNPQQRTEFLWLGSYISAAIIFLACYVLIRFDVITVPFRYHDTLQKLSLAGFFGILILSASKLIEIIIIRKSHSKYKRYNLIRLTH